jgi:ankyrin repeat protein
MFIIRQNKLTTYNQNLRQQRQQRPQLALTTHFNNPLSLHPALFKLIYYMNLTPLPQHDDPIVPQFTPEHGQWELNDDNMKRIDPKNGYTILHNYCKYINTTPLAVYRYLIETLGCDVNAQDENESTPIHRALREFDPNKGGNISVLTYLLTRKGVNGNIKDVHGCALLHTACTRFNKLPIDIFELLIEKHSADVNALPTYNDTPLHSALLFFNPRDSGDINVLTYLLSQNGINSTIKGQRGYTLLHYACQKINILPITIFKLLIENHDADVNLLDDNNDTPVHLAFRAFDPHLGGDITALTYLINQKNVNLNIRGERGRTLLHLACINNFLSYKRSVKQKAETDTVLCQIVEILAERCIQEVLDETTPLEATTTM